jgi:hypothetical protein
MAMSSLFEDRNRLGRMIWSTAALAAATLAAMLVPPWIWPLCTPQVLRQATIRFLIGLEVAYAVVVIAALIGAAAFGGLFYRARRRRQTSATAAARGLLLCIGCLCALAFAEGAAGLWRASPHGFPSSTRDVPALPDRFPEPSDSDSVSVAVVGESSAVGVPFDSWLSVGEIVAWQLGQAIPGKRFRVELVATPGDTLAGQYEKLTGIRRRPDVLIVYCGHNEFAAGIPWWRYVQHYLDDRPPLLWGLDELAGRVSPLCALICETADKYRASVVPTYDVERPLVDVPAYTRAEFAARFVGFRRSLEAIAVYGERIGALTVLVVPPANDAGFDPNRSVLPAETPRLEREAFARAFLAARQSEDSEPARAVTRYRALLDRQPGFAETHYRMGILLDRAGAWDEAYRHFVAARDLDGFPMRCLNSIQQMYREVAARHQCILVDGQAVFHAIGPHGLLDDHLFQDAMHPSLRGHIALAQAILEALCARRAFGWNEEASAPRIDPARCAAHFGLGPKEWKVLSERGYMFYYATTPMRFDRAQRLAKRNAFEIAARRIAAGDSPEAIGMPNIGIPAPLRGSDLGVR